MKPRSTARLATAIATLLAASAAHAASAAWNVDAATTWDTDASWTPGTAPGSTTLDNADIATFSFPLTAARIVTVDADRFIGGIDFANTSTFGYTLGTGILHLNSGGVIQTLTANGAHTDTISSPIVISGTSAATATVTASATLATSLLKITTSGVIGSATVGNITTLTLNGTNTAAAGGNAISGVIGDGAGGGVLAIAKSGASNWTLSGTNTYTGVTTVSVGTLSINTFTNGGVAGSLGMSSAAASNLVIAGGTLSYTGGGATSDRSLTLSGNGIFTVTTAGANLNIAGSITGGTFNVTKGGGGTLTLSGANTWTGRTFVSGGILSINSIKNVGGAANSLGMPALANATINIGSTTAAGILSYVGTGDITDRVINLAGTTGGATLDQSGGSLLKFTSPLTAGGLGNKTLTLLGSTVGTGEIAGAIVNSTGFATAVTKTGSGTWTLSGVNLYTGATTVNGGTLALGFGGVPANILSPSSPLTMGGGTLQLTGTGTQTVNGLTTTASTSSRILLGADETLTLGALTAAGAGSSLNFNTTTGGANGATVGTGVVVLTGQTPGTAINPGFTVTDVGGFGLATVNGSDQVVRQTIATLLPAAGATSGIDYRVDNNAGGVAADGSSTLAITASEAARSITVDTTTANGVLTLNSGVVLSNNLWQFGGIGSNTYQVTGDAGGASLQSVASNDTITLNNTNTGSVTIASPILANGTNAVIVNGSGTTVFSGANTFTGATFVTNGTLSLTGNRTVIPTAAVSYDLGSASASVATLNIGGDLPLATTQIRVAVNGPATVNQTAGLVSFSGATGNELTVGITAGMPGTYNLSGGTLQTVAVANRGVLLGVNNNSSGTFNLSDSGTLTMASASVLAICRGDNVTATGATGVFNQTGGTATVGELRMGGNFNFGALGANSTASLNLSGGTFSAVTFNHLSGGNTSNSSINISNTALVTLPAFPTARGTGSTATITFDGGTLSPLTASATYMGGLTNAFIKAGGAKFDTTNGSITITQNLLTDVSSLNGGLTKNGANTLTLTGTNTYTGTTTVSQGVLAISGNSIADGNKLVIDGGTVDLTGAETVNTLFFGAAQQGPGTYGPLGSIFPIISSANFTGTGTLIVTNIPVSSGYAGWKSANSTTQTIDLDHDNDGVSNGVEYFLGGNTNTTGFTALPGVTNIAGTLSVTWTKAISYTGTYGTDFLVETSATLAAGSWATEASPGTVTIAGNSVKYTFPAGAKNFARLKVTGP